LRLRWKHLVFQTSSRPVIRDMSRSLVSLNNGFRCCRCANSNKIVLRISNAAHCGWYRTGCEGNLRFGMDGASSRGEGRHWLRQIAVGGHSAEIIRRICSTLRLTPTPHRWSVRQIQIAELSSGNRRSLDPSGILQSVFSHDSRSSQGVKPTPIERRWIKQSPCASGSGLKYSDLPMHYPMPPSAQEEARESTLSWFIRALNGLEPKERRELLRQIPRELRLTCRCGGTPGVPL